MTIRTADSLLPAGSLATADGLVNPLPTKENLLELDTSWRGAPFVRVEAKSLSTAELDFSWRGAPFVAAPGSYVPPPVVLFTPILMVI